MLARFSLSLPELSDIGLSLSKYNNKIACSDGGADFCKTLQQAGERHSLGSKYWKGSGGSCQTTTAPIDCDRSFVEAKNPN